MKEIWKQIKDYEDLYLVSSFGNIVSLPKGDGNGNRKRKLKQEVCKKKHTDYRRVAFSKNGKVKRFLVHRLVASAFIDNPENKPQVNHIDSNGENNHVSNLEWCTGSENMLHSCFKGNTTSKIQKEKRSKVKKPYSGGSKSPAKDFEKSIYKDFKNGMTKVDISKKYCFSIDTIYNSIKRQILKEEQGHE